jgi:hypothetical protein
VIHHDYPFVVVLKELYMSNITNTPTIVWTIISILYTSYSYSRFLLS